MCDMPSSHAPCLCPSPTQVLNVLELYSASGGLSFVEEAECAGGARRRRTKSSMCVHGVKQGAPVPTRSAMCIDLEGKAK